MSSKNSIHESDSILIETADIQEKTKPSILSLATRNFSSLIVDLTSLCRFFFLLYYLFSIVYRVCFIENFIFSQRFATDLIFDYGVDFFFLLDFGLKLKSKNKIRSVAASPTNDAFLTILKSTTNSDDNLYIRLTIDGLSLFPFEIIGYFANYSQYPLLRVVRLLRLLNFFEYWSDVVSVLLRFELFQNIGVRRVCYFFFLLAIEAHCGACLFYAIGISVLRQRVEDGKYDASYDGINRMSTWVEYDGLVAIDSNSTLSYIHPLDYRYLRSLYWSIQTLLTVGFGDQTAHSQPETWFCIFFFYISGLMLMTAISNLVLLITKLDAAKTAHLQRESNFAKFAAYRQLPADLTRRVKSFHKYQWEQLGGVDEHKILAEIPHNLAEQVHQVVFHDVIGAIDIFKNVNRILLNAIVEAVDPQAFSPMDVIIDVDTMVTGIYIISRGEVEVIIGDGVDKCMMAGDHFGATSLVHKFSTPKQLRAKTFAEVLYLSSSHFRGIAKRHLTTAEYEALFEELTVAVEDSDDRIGSPGCLLMKTRTVRSSLTLLRSASSNKYTTEKSWSDIFLPESRFRSYWDSVLLLGNLVYHTVVPLLLAGTLHDNFGFTSFGELLLLGYVVDLLFVVNTVFEASLFGFFDDEGIAISSPSKILEHFLATNSVPLTVLAIVPWDLIAYGISGNVRVIPLIRLLKLLDSVKINYYIEVFLDFLLVEFRITVSFEFFRFLSLYYLLFQLCHWVGCLFQLVADTSTKVFGYHMNWRIADRESITYSAIDMNYAGLDGTNSYWRSVYWAMSCMSSIAFPDILCKNPAETLFCCVVMFFGCPALNALVGGIASMIGSFKREKKDFYANLEQIKELSIYKKIPDKITDKITRYYEYLWMRYEGVDESKCLDDLPKSLRSVVMQYVAGPVIEKIPFFASCTQPMQFTIANLLSRRTFLHDDLIVTAGEYGKEMFIIEKGTVQVTTPNRSAVIATLTDNAYIGESCLLHVTRRMASAYAVGYCDTYYLTKEQFLKAAESFPHEYTAVIQSIQMIIDENAAKNARRQNEPDRDLPPTNVQSLDSEASINQEKKPTPPVKTHHFEYIDSTSFAHPASSRRALWNIAMLLCLVYYAFMIPLRIAAEIPPLFYIFDYAIDVIFWLDIYLSWCYFYVYSRGELIIETPSIKELYWKQLFVEDLCAGLPYDMFALCFLGSSRQSMRLARALFRLPKAIRMKRFSGYFEQVAIVANKLQVSYFVIRVAELTGTIVMIAWVVACAFYMFGGDVQCVSSENDLESCFRGTWVEQQIIAGKLPPDGGDQMSRFIRAMNFAIPTLTEEIIGDIFPFNERESLFIFFTMFCGVTVFGTVIGSMSSLVAETDQDTARMIRKKEVLKKHLIEHHKDVPDQIINGSIGFLSYLTSQVGKLTLRQRKVFLDLPYSLQIEIDGHLKTTPFLRRCPFFDFCDDEVLRGLSAKMKLVIYSSGDSIVSIGDLGHEMYFIESGAAEVVGPNGEIYNILQAGGFFGETALFFKTKRAATVRAATSVCVCYTLSKEDLDHELSTTEFDMQKTFEAFNNLQDMNNKRNAATSKNLKLAKDNPNHKLYRHLKLHDQADHSKHTIFYTLRRNLTPESRFRIAWDCAGLLFILYFALGLPFYIAFLFGPAFQAYLPFLFVDFCIDVYWIVDIFFKAYIFTFKLSANSDDYEMEGTKIMTRYKKFGHFFVDVLASVPLELFTLLPGYGIDYIFCWRVNHLLRVAQIFDYVTLVEGHLEVVFNWTFKRTQMTVFRALLGYILTNHWLASIYFMIHRYEEWDRPITYVIADGHSLYDATTGTHDVCSSSISFCYARSIYFVLGTMTSVGYGDIGPYTNPEFLWEQCVAIIGALVAAVFCGAYTSFLEDIDSSGDAMFQQKLKQVKKYIEFRQLKPELAQSIFAQYELMWKEDKSTGEKESSLIADLPTSMAMNISALLKSDIISLVPIINTSPGQLKLRIANALRSQVAMPGGLIYDVGFVGVNLFFVLSGDVQVTLANDHRDVDTHGLDALVMLKRKEEAIGQMHGPGTHFGEYCLITKSGLRPDRAVAKTRTEIYGLSCEAIEELFLFTGLAERKTFIFELMTKVQDLIHTDVPLNLDDTNDENHDVSHTRLLHRFSYRIMKEIFSALGPDEVVRDRTWSQWLSDAKDTSSNRSDTMGGTTREDFAAYLHDSHRVGNRVSFSASGFTRQLSPPKPEGGSGSAGLEEKSSGVPVFSSSSSRVSFVSSFAAYAEGVEGDVDESELDGLDEDTAGGIITLRPSLNPETNRDNILQQSDSQEKEEGD